MLEKGGRRTEEVKVVAGVGEGGEGRGEIKYMGKKRAFFKRNEERRGERAYFATGSGVTPYHASSVIQIPSSYRENMLRRW